MLPVHSEVQEPSPFPYNVLNIEFEIKEIRGRDGGRLFLEWEEERGVETRGRLGSQKVGALVYQEWGLGLPEGLSMGATTCKQSSDPKCLPQP